MPKIGFDLMLNRSSELLSFANWKSNLSSFATWLSSLDCFLQFMTINNWIVKIFGILFFRSANKLIGKSEILCRLEKCFEIEFWLFRCTLRGRWREAVWIPSRNVCFNYRRWFVLYHSGCRAVCRWVDDFSRFLLFELSPQHHFTLRQFITIFFQFFRGKIESLTYCTAPC